MLSDMKFSPMEYLEEQERIRKRKNLIKVIIGFLILFLFVGALIKWMPRHSNNLKNGEVVPWLFQAGIIYC